MSIVIGLVGKPSAGKGMAGKILERLVKEAGFTSARYSSGDLLRETLALWDIRPDRTNLQLLPRIMTAPNAFGPAALSVAIHAKLIKEKANVVIADGMRWKSDEEMLQSIPNSKILYITADQKIRYERLVSRHGVGEEEKTWEQFALEDRRETEVYIEEFGSRADWTIQNDGTVEQFEQNLRAFFEVLVVPFLSGGK